jgi:hypothetical protein
LNLRENFLVLIGPGYGEVLTHGDILEVDNLIDEAT